MTIGAQSPIMLSMTTTDVTLIPVPTSDLAERLNRRSSRSRYSKGFKVVEQFLASETVAATIQTKDVLERNLVLTSAKSYIASSQGDNVTVWAKASGPQEVLLINLAKADAATKTAYANRPRVGRKAAAKK